MKIYFEENLNFHQNDFKNNMMMFKDSFILTVYDILTLSLSVSFVTHGTISNQNTDLFSALLPTTAKRPELAKGQLISKCPFGVFKSPKKQQQFFRISAVASKGQLISKTIF